MMNQNYFGYYYVPLAQEAGLQGAPLLLNLLSYQEYLLQEQQRLIFEKGSLVTELNSCNEEIEQARVENQELREVVQKTETRIKRRYRKRRTWLEKKFRCNMRGCRGKYSSKIALNSHKRRKHPKQPKQ